MRKSRLRRIHALRVDVRRLNVGASASGLDAGDRKRLRHDSVLAAAVEVRIGAVSEVLAIPLLLGFISAGVAATVAVARHFGDPSDRALAEGAAVVVFAAFGTALSGPRWVAKRVGISRGTSVSWYFTLLLIAGAIGAVAMWRGTGSPTIRYAAALGAAWWLVFAIGVLVAAVILAAVNSFLRRGRDTTFGASIAAGELLAARWVLSTEKDWRSATSRAFAAQAIERAAVVIETGLCDELASSSPTTRDATVTRCREVAAALRELEVAVLLRGTTTRCFSEAMSEAARALLRGELEDLPVAKPPAKLAPKALAVRVLRTGAVALLPAALVGGIQATVGPLEGPAAGYAATACVGWAVVTVVAALDPLFRDKVAAVKEAAGLLRP